MQIKPNKTLLKGRVRAIRPEADGWGADVDLVVLENKSLSKKNDFIRPELGSILTAFTSEPEKLAVGDEVKVQATLRADAFGERTVLESVSPL